MTFRAHRIYISSCTNFFITEWCALIFLQHIKKQNKMDTERTNTFATLNAIDVSQDIKQKDERRGLSYLPWAKAWGHLMTRFPDSTYKVYENAAGLPYFSDGHTAFVKVGATVKGIEHIEFLAVMDHRNQSITLDHLTSVDVVKSIQRCLVKALARHGLGLYIYSGEDLPDEYRENEAASTWEELSETIELAVNRDELTEIWTANKHLHGNKKFKDAITAKGKELKND